MDPRDSDNVSCAVSFPVSIHLAYRRPFLALPSIMLRIISISISSISLMIWPNYSRLCFATNVSIELSDAIRRKRMHRSLVQVAGSHQFSSATISSMSMTHTELRERTRSVPLCPRPSAVTSIANVACISYHVPTTTK